MLLKGTDQEKYENIGEYLGVRPGTVGEWFFYSKVSEDIRSFLVKNNIRSKGVLRKAVKLSKHLEDESMSANQREKYLKEHFYRPLLNKSSLSKKIKESKPSGISNFAFRDNNTGTLHSRSSWKKLSKKQQLELSDFLENLAAQIREA